MASTSESFGTYVKSVRTAAHLSQRALAERLGISHAYVAQVESGRRGPFLPSRWPDLVALGADPATLADLTRAWAVADLEAKISRLRVAIVATHDTLSHG